MSEDHIASFEIGDNHPPHEKSVARLENKLHARGFLLGMTDEIIETDKMQGLEIEHIVASVKIADLIEPEVVLKDEYIIAKAAINMIFAEARRQNIVQGMPGQEVIKGGPFNPFKPRDHIPIRMPFQRQCYPKG